METRTAAELTALGYRRTSNKHRMVSRIDRPDWKEHLAAHLRRSVAELFIVGTNAENGLPIVSDKVSGSWCDYYRRCLSRDTLEGLPEATFRAIPSSGWDSCGFVEIE